MNLTPSMQPSSESVNKMKERFLASLFSEDSKYNSVLMTKQKYESTIEDVKRIKVSNKKESSRDYRIIQRYDVVTVEGCEILIEPLSDTRESVKKFVHAEELFDILYTTHLSIGHGGRDRMIKQLNALYKNITQAQIKMFLDLCEFCQQKSAKKGTNAPINMVEDNGFDLNGLCRICSSDLQDKGVGIFSAECMDNLVGEKIRRYLYFSVSIKDNLPKMVCTTCLKKLENIHRFAKMAAEMQEKFRMLLATKQEKPKIKIKSLDDINKEAAKESIESSVAEDSGKTKLKADVDENLEMNLDVAVEEVGDNSEDVKIEEINSCNQDCQNAKKKEKKNSSVFNGVSESTECRAPSVEDENEADTSDSDRLVIQDEEKPNPSLLHCLLLKGKQQMSTDIDHDYLMKVKEEPEIKEEPADPEDEDIAEEIAEDRLNQIIKDEMDSESEQDSEPDENSDLEITEMEVKVDPTLYFSNASQSGNEIEQDSQDGQDSLMADGGFSNNSNGSPAPPESERKSNEKKDTSADRPLVMTRLQQKMNPVIASLKLGKPYKCTLCPRSFITDIGLQNHLWSHLPKSRKSQANGGTMIPKNIDLEDSQVYSSNGVLHTALPSENPHLLKYVCPICGKKISTKGNLKVHLETHRPKGKYGCDICGRVFKTAANLFRHKDYHGGVQFPCPVCGRVYPTNSTLRAHSITHSDLRPHKCPLCSKTFKRNQDLKFHINQHTGARPYQCPYCPKAFASSGNCFSHRKRMHPLEVERDKERAAEIMG